MSGGYRQLNFSITFSTSSIKCYNFTVLLSCDRKARPEKYRVLSCVFTFMLW
jgi:hypothetical protein